MEVANRIIVAFDIETSGGNFTTNQIIALGMCAMNQKFKVLDSLRLDAYVPNLTKFEPRTWDEFWCKNQNKLDTFNYKGILKTNREIETWLIGQFQEFRRKFEIIAKKENAEYYLVSDNNIFDGGFINALINKYTTDGALPYSASDNTYSSFFETHSMQKGLLLALPNEFDVNAKWGFTKRISEIYDVPVMEHKHDHSPENDAYTIAYDFNTLVSIGEGTIRKKVEVNSEN